jgi:hypothetical protein
MEESEEWDGRERRSGRERRNGTSRRVDRETRKRLIVPTDGDDDRVIPDEQWDRRSNQDRRGHPFYTPRES